MSCTIGKRELLIYALTVHSIHRGRVWVWGLGLGLGFGSDPILFVKVVRLFGIYH